MQELLADSLLPSDRFRKAAAYALEREAELRVYLGRNILSLARRSYRHQSSRASDSSATHGEKKLDVLLDRSRRARCRYYSDPRRMLQIGRSQSVRLLCKCSAENRCRPEFYSA